MVAQLGSRRKLNLPPQPVVTYVEGDTYKVDSVRSGNDYTATVADDGSVTCDCPARGRCCHMGFVAVEHARRLMQQRVEDIDALVKEIMRLCENECLDRFEKDDAIWKLAKRIEIARRRERESERLVA
jgi:hypothetical protein